MLALARQGYTASQVEAALRNGAGFYGSRFELLDQASRTIGGFDANPSGAQPGTILAASVDWDVDRKLVGAIDLKMLPDDRLRGVPFQRRIKAWMQVGPMPDGGVVEFPVGVFLWAVPERDIAPGVEEWSVTLPDGLHDLELGDPPLGGFQAGKGEPKTRTLGRIVNASGFTDLSGIQSNESVWTGSRTWGITRPKSLFGITYVPNFQAGWGYFSNGDTISYGGTNPNETRTSTWLDIAHDIHDGMGYRVPWMDGDGIYQAQPSMDWTRATPVVTFGTGNDSVTVSPLHDSNDFAPFCNRVRQWSEAGDAALFFVEKDANVEVPGHPLSQAKIGRYTTRNISSSTAGSQLEAERQARAALLDGLSTQQRVTFDTLFWPVEPFDLVGVMVAEDVEYASRQTFQERKVSLDMFSGVMRHDATRTHTVST